MQSACSTGWLGSLTKTLRRWRRLGQGLASPCPLLGAPVDCSEGGGGGEGWRGGEGGGGVVGISPPLSWLPRWGHTSAEIVLVVFDGFYFDEVRSRPLGSAWPSPASASSTVLRGGLALSWVPRLGCGARLCVLSLGVFLFLRGQFFISQCILTSALLRCPMRKDTLVFLIVAATRFAFVLHS